MQFYLVCVAKRISRFLAFFYC